MVMNIADVLAAYRQPAANGAGDDAGKATLAGGQSFSDTLKQFADGTLDAIKQGEQSTASLASGKGNLQDVILAVQNAELALQEFTSIRDKVIAAYQEIIRTAV